MRRHHIIRIITVIAGLNLLNGCKHEAVLSSHNLLEGKILTVVHACGGFETYRNPIPANTASAMERSIAQGANGIEFDLQMTSDGQIVVFHDSDLMRASTCQGCIQNKSFEEIQACRYMTRNGAIDGNFPIASFEDLLEIASKSGQNLMLFANTKHFTGCEPTDLPQYYQTFASKIIEIAEKHGQLDNLILESLDAEFLIQARNVNPNVKLLFDDESFERGMEIVRQNHFLGLAISNAAVTTEQVQAAHAEGYWLGIWGVKVLAATKEAIEKGPEFVMTDDLQMLQGQLKK